MTIPSAPRSSVSVAPVDTSTTAIPNECNVPADFTKLDQHLLRADETLVLEWRQRSDNRPLFIDEAVVWQRGHDDGGTWWFLATIYRHPKEENEFKPSIVYDADVVPQKRFDHPPTNTELENFLGGTTWNWHDDSFKRTGGQTCVATWTRVIGAPPPAPNK